MDLRNRGGVEMGGGGGDAVVLLSDVGIEMGGGGGDAAVVLPDVGKPSKLVIRWMRCVQSDDGAMLEAPHKKDQTNCEHGDKIGVKAQEVNANFDQDATSPMRVGITLVW
eukprot:5345062-Amphidinium_carterae.1